MSRQRKGNYERVGFQVDIATRQLIETQAEAKGVPMSDIVRSILWEGLNPGRIKTEYDKQEDRIARLESRIRRITAIANESNNGG